MGNLMRIAELEGRVERKDAYIDKLELKLDEVQKDRDQRAELSARLFSENEQLKHQINIKQLEIDHCHAVCGELRDELTKAKNECERLRSLAVAAADLSIDVAQTGIEATKRIEELAGLLERWQSDPDAYPADETLIDNTSAALARAKAGA